MDTLILTQQDVEPHGLRCMDCDEKMSEGMAYSHRLIGVTEDNTPIVEIICVPCALKTTA